MEPTLTSKNLPPTQRGLPPTPPSSAEVATPYEQIVAKPLRAPNFISLFPKNPNICLYWGTRAVGEKQSSMRYDQLVAMGFVAATPDDVYTTNPETGAKLPCPPSLCRDGKVFYGDVILLKISRADYIGALKWNEQSARQRVRKPGVAIEGDKSGDARVQPSNVLPNHPKIKSYTPDLAEVDAKTSDNSGPSANLADGKPLR